MAKTILVVDDSASLRQVVSIALKGGGYDIIEACDGQDALGKLNGRKINLIISDVNMPVMDGITFLRAARAEFGPDRPRVVLCTTEAELARIVQALEAGAQEYVMKPFDAEIIRDKFTQAGLLEEAA